MNCTECKRLLVEYTENLLEASPKRSIADHLEKCSVCKEEAEIIRTLQTRLIEDSQVAGQTYPEDEVMNRILREQNAMLKTTNTVSLTSYVRSMIMKKSVIRIAAAAVVIIAAFIGLNSLQNNLTFARVVEPVLNAQTVVYDVVFGDTTDGVALHDIVVDRKIRRTLSNMETILILDLDNSRMLDLNPVSKSALFLDIQGTLADTHRDLLHSIRNAINEAINDTQSAIEELGHTTINGLDVVGFRSSLGVGDDEITIWADSTTAKPVQIELRQGQVLIAFKNIEFDVPVDESLVSMEVPPGYTLSDQEVDMTQFSEQDFLTVLQIWAEYLLEGHFPDSMTMEDLLKLPPQLGSVIPRMNLAPDRAEELGTIFGRGLMFLSYLVSSGAEWEYVGNGVQFGKGDEQILWYRMPDSQSYRVIYGDLRIEDVVAQNQP